MLKVAPGGKVCNSMYSKYIGPRLKKYKPCSIGLGYSVPHFEGFCNIINLIDLVVQYIFVS